VPSNFIGDVLAYSGEPVAVYEMLSDRERRFFDAIVSDEDLIAVLRGHLYVEADVTDLLVGLFPGSSELLDDLTYFQKVRRLKKSMELPPGVAATLEALGTLRNSFAHNLDRVLREDDDQRFFSILGDDFKPSVQRLVDMNAFPQPSGGMVRACIIVVHTGLAALRLRPTREEEQT
jgi:hypothetical protein